MVTSCSVTSALPIATNSTGYPLEILHAMNRHLKHQGTTRPSVGFKKISVPWWYCDIGICLDIHQRHPSTFAFDHRAKNLDFWTSCRSWLVAETSRGSTKPTNFSAPGWFHGWNPQKSNTYQRLEGYVTLCLSSKGLFFRYMLSFIYKDLANLNQLNQHQARNSWDR